MKQGEVASLKSDGKSNDHRVDHELNIWKDLVVIVAGVSWDDARMSEKQLALALKERVPILYVDPPISILTPLRKPHLDAPAKSSMRILGPRLARLTPAAPPGVSRPVLRDIAAAVTRRAIGNAVDSLGVRPHAIVAASLDDVFDSCPTAVRVLWGTDDWVSGAELMGQPTGRLKRQERRRLGSADIVLSVGEKLADRWAALSQNVFVFPNGCDAETFAGVPTQVPASDIALKGPAAGFVGHISERIDISLLEAVADIGVDLLLVGPTALTSGLAGFKSLVSRSNVQWMGSRPFQELPRYLAAMSVGLTPYVLSDFNRSSSPLKSVEYLAAGLPVVSTDLPASRALPRQHVHIARTPEEFALRVRGIIDVGINPGDQKLRQEHAKRLSWHARADQLLRILGHPRLTE